MNIKVAGDAILKKVRNDLGEFANNDLDKRFEINRWVYARLQLDERRTKKNLKKKLMRKNKYCGDCGREFRVKKFIDIHRLDREKGYSEGNCILVCSRKCHHRIEKQSGYKRIYNQKVLLKKSKRYSHYGNTLYWWDITDNEKFKYIKRKNGIIVFQEKDTGTKHVYYYKDISDFLTKGRKTTRNGGRNWGIRILREKPGNLAFEPGIQAHSWKYVASK